MKKNLRQSQHLLSAVGMAVLGLCSQAQAQEAETKAKRAHNHLSSIPTSGGQLGDISIGHTKVLEHKKSEQLSVK